MILKVFRSGEWQDLELDENEAIVFPDGLVGCGDWRRFALWDELGDGTVWTLLSIDEPGISLLATDPRHVLSEYKVNVSPDDLEDLKADDVADLVTLCILVVRQDPPSVTANLVGPLVINTKKKLGKQMVLSDSEYSLRHPVILGGHNSTPNSPDLARSA